MTQAMKHFFLRPDSTFGEYDVNVAHTLFLPGVRCPKCGTWARTGTAYPTITRSILSPILSRLNGSPLLLEKFQELRGDILGIIGSGRPLFPGTHFDISVGQATGTLPDFPWSNPWTLFAQDAVYRKLQHLGFSLSGAAVHLTSRKTIKPDIVELEAVPHVRLHKDILNAQGVEECDLCGRIGIRKPEVIVLDKASLDPSIPIQRVYELTTIIVNEELAQAIRSEQLSGIELIPVESA